MDTDSWEAGLEEFPSEEPEPLECPEEALEMVDIRLSVEDMMYGITTDPTRLFFFSVREQGWKYTSTTNRSLFRAYVDLTEFYCNSVQTDQPKS